MNEKELEKVLRKIENGREYRSMVLEVREGADGDSEEKIVEGYATTFNEPYYLYSFEREDGEVVTVNEQVDREAFDGADMSDVIFQYDHEGRVFARLSNGTMELNDDDHGLKVKANLGGTEIGRNLYEEIRGGYTNKMSFGFTVAKADITPDGDKKYIRTIRKIGKLFDVSAVSYPQNNFTEISARKNCEGVIASIEAERLEVEKREKEKAKKMEDLKARLSKLREEASN